jgi:F0F1-type ATP synthase assembly protein I
VWKWFFCARTMTEVRARNQRLVLKFLLAQSCCAALVAVAELLYSGLAAAHAALAGGVIVAVGTAIFGWRLFAPGVAPARVLARGLYAGAALKWVWLGVAVWFGIARAGLSPLPLLLGMLAAQIGFWIGMARFR